MSAGDKFVEMQHHIRENSAFLQDYLVDLANWEQDMKKADVEVLKKRPSEAKSDSEPNAPPSTSADRAVALKDEGNKHFKDGHYEDAIKCYTAGIEEDPKNAVLLGNRALVYMKTGELGLAEDDCTHCIALDPRYVKAYLRRGASRLELQKFAEARLDFRKVLELEPKNKQALIELAKLHKEARRLKRKVDFVTSSKQVVPDFENGEDEPDSCVISPIDKPLHLRSKKPFVSVPVEEVDDSTDRFKDRPPSEKKPDEQKLSFSRALTSLPPVPEVSYRFFTDWKKISEVPELRFEYLKQFPPENFPVLFKLSMEVELFGGILETLNDFVSSGMNVFPYMKFLSEVGRFRTLLMLLSEEEYNNLKKLLNHVKASNDHTDDEKHSICKLYDL